MVGEVSQVVAIRIRGMGGPGLDDDRVHHEAGCDGRFRVLADTLGIDELLGDHDELAARGHRVSEFARRPEKLRVAVRIDPMHMEETERGLERRHDAHGPSAERILHDAEFVRHVAALREVAGALHGCRGHEREVARSGHQRHRERAVGELLDLDRVRLLLLERAPEAMRGDRADRVPDVT